MKRSAAIARALAASARALVSGAFVGFFCPPEERRMAPSSAKQDRLLFSYSLLGQQELWLRRNTKPKIAKRTCKSTRLRRFYTVNLPLNWDRRKSNLFGRRRREEVHACCVMGHNGTGVLTRASLVANSAELSLPPCCVLRAPGQRSPAKAFHQQCREPHPQSAGAVSNC